MPTDVESCTKLTVHVHPMSRGARSHLVLMSRGPNPGLAGLAVRTETTVGRVAQPAVWGDVAVQHFCDELRPHRLDTARVLARHWDVEGARLPLQRAQHPGQVAQHLFGEAGPDPADIHEVAGLVVLAENQGPEHGRIGVPRR